MNSWSQGFREMSVLLDFWCHLSQKWRYQNSSNRSVTLIGAMKSEPPASIGERHFRRRSNWQHVAHSVCIRGGLQNILLSMSDIEHKSERFFFVWHLCHLAVMLNDETRLSDVVYYGQQVQQWFRLLVDIRDEVVRNLHKYLVFHHIWLFELGRWCILWRYQSVMPIG